MSGQFERFHGKVQSNKSGLPSEELDCERNFERKVTAKAEGKQRKLNGTCEMKSKPKKPDNMPKHDLLGCVRTGDIHFRWGKARGERQNFLSRHAVKCDLLKQTMQECAKSQGICCNHMIQRHDWDMPAQKSCFTIEKSAKKLRHFRQTNATHIKSHFSTKWKKYSGLDA